LKVDGKKLAKFAKADVGTGHRAPHFHPTMFTPE
jgi:hypothetical protein